MSAAKRTRVAAAASATDDAGAAEEDGLGPDDAVQVDAMQRRAGWIRFIQLENFMCHENLKVTLKPDVNFITGRNGSGKSAIFSGLALVFGSTARNTGRGDTAASFIRTGCHSAVVRVALCNEGAGALPEYGDTIVIERHIRDGTGGGYRVLDADGRKRAEKAAEVRSIASRLGVLINNPFMLMSQDSARQFLQASSAHEKYQLLMRATAVDDIREKLRLAGDEIQKVERELQALQTRTPELEERERQAQVVYNSTQRERELQAEVSKLDVEIAWHAVRDLRRMMATQEQKLAQRQAELEQRRAERAQALQRLEEARASQNDIQGRAAALRADIARVVQDQDRLREALGRADGALRLAQREVQTAQRAVDGQRAAVQRKEADLRRLQQRQQTGDAAGLAEKVAQREAEVEAARRGLEALQADRRAREAQEAELQSRVRERRTRQGQLEARVRALAGEVQKSVAARQSGHPASAYGHLDLVRAVEANARLFSRPPIGPIGAVIRVQPEAVLAVEAALRGGDQWVVASAADSFALRQLAKQLRVKLHTVLVVAEYDQAMTADDSVLRTLGVPSLMSQILEAPVPVQNALLDSFSVDTYPVFATVPEGTRFYDKVLPGQPASVRQAVHNTASVLDGSIVRGPPPRGGGYATTTAPYSKGNPMKVILSMKNPEDTTRQLEAELAQARAESADVSAAVAAAQDELDRFLRDGVALNRQVQTEQRRLHDLESELSGLRRELERVQRLADNTELQEAEVALQEYRAGLERAEAELETARRAMQTRQDERNAVQRQLEEIQRRVKDLQGSELLVNAEDTLEMVTALSTVVTELDIKVASSENRVEEAQTKLASLRPGMAVAEAEACAVGPEPSTYEFASAEKAQAGKRRLEQQLARTRAQQQISADAARKDLAAAQNDLRQHTELIELLADRCEKLRRSMEKRLSVLHRLRGEICVGISAKFSQLLLKRNFLGALRVDHDKEEVTLEVNTQALSEAGRAVSDSRQLSGGERSFSTVALLLGVWSCMQETPFLGVDEFDVFMDPVARSLALRFLVEEALAAQPYRQYLFLTPLDRAGIPVGKRSRVDDRTGPFERDLVHLVALKPPQRTLPPAPASA